MNTIIWDEGIHLRKLNEFELTSGEKELLKLLEIKRQIHEKYLEQP